jgi:hypothetical protein
LPLGSIIGNTFVSDAAANTVGAAPAEVVVVAGGLDAAVGATVGLEAVDDELLPHPAARATALTNVIATAARFSNGAPPSWARQDPSTILELWP